MRVTKILSLLIIFIFLGCGRTDTSQSVSTNSTPLQQGTIKFDIVFSDATTNKRGHFSTIVQAKDSLGKPISGLESATYSIYENNIKKSESRITVAKDQKSVSNNILLLLDFSGSIIDDCDKISTDFDPTTNQYIIQNRSRLDNNLCFKLISSAKDFIDKTVNESQKMAIYYFNSQTEITALATSNTASATSDTTILKQKLDKLYTLGFRNSLSGLFSTNLYGGVVEATKTACKWVENCNYDIYRPNQNINVDNFNFASIVVFTDGDDQAGIVNKSDMLEFLSFHDSLYYYTIGLGKVNDNILKQIGKNGYMKATNTQGLDEKFNLLADELNDWSNSFYRIEFCPATQVGEVDIKIEATDNSQKLQGSFIESIDLSNIIDFRCDL